MGDTVFPPISRKIAISVTNETDRSDYNFNSGDGKAFTGGAVQSISNSPLKFPNINRSNTTVVASLPGPRAVRHRSQCREQRPLYCRSPSCLSHLDISRDHVDKFKKETPRDLSIHADDFSHEPQKPEHDLKLPRIFYKENNERLEKSNMMSSRHKNNDTSRGLSLQSDESVGIDSFDPVISPNAALTSQDSEQRHNQGAALLLPIRTTTKKQKRRSRIQSDREVLQKEIQMNNEADYHKTRLRFKNEIDVPLKAIAPEDDIFNDDNDTTKAFDISSSKKVKQWISSSQNAKNERQIKT